MTFVEASSRLMISIGMLFREIGNSIQPDYWVCTNCGHVKYHEEEVMCWKCGIGEMIYKGVVKVL